MKPRVPDASGPVVKRGACQTCSRPFTLVLRLTTTAGHRGICPYRDCGAVFTDLPGSVVDSWPGEGPKPVR